VKKTWIVLLAAVAAVAQAQDSPERVTVPLSDPTKPGTVRVEVMQGSVSIRGTTAKEIIVEARGGAGRRKPRGDDPPGMRRIEVRGSGLNIEEHSNVVRIETSPMYHGAEIDIQVPARTSVKVETVSGAIKVENVEGEMDVNTTNGSITMTNVSGAVLAHCLNGPLKVVFDRITPNKPMSFSTLNGPIDVTFPADLKANLKLKTENGDVFTDFEMAVKPQPAPTGERAGGRYRVRFDRAFYGMVGGGGPEIQFTTLNGRIFIRKKT
jgi:DUF4097 and DUF4098 domain-containing protein YvlB